MPLESLVEFPRSLNLPRTLVEVQGLESCTWILSRWRRTSVWIHQLYVDMFWRSRKQEATSRACVGVLTPVSKGSHPERLLQILSVPQCLRFLLVKNLLDHASLSVGPGLHASGVECMLSRGGLC